MRPALLILLLPTGCSRPASSTASAPPVQAVTHDEEVSESPAAAPPAPSAEAPPSFEGFLERERLPWTSSASSESAGVAVRWKAAIRLRRPILADCANESRFGKGKERQRCIFQTLCEIELGALSGGTTISYPGPFALSVELGLDGRPTHVQGDSAESKVSCSEFSPRSAPFQEGGDPIPSLAMGEDWLLRGVPVTLSWSHGGAGEFVSSLPLEFASASGGPPHRVESVAVWQMVGSCRGPWWHRAVPLTLASSLDQKVESGRTVEFSLDITPTEFHDGCMAFRVHAKVDGVLTALEIPVTTYRFEPDSLIIEDESADR